MSDRSFLILLDEESPNGGPAVFAQGDSLEFMEVVRAAAAVLRPLVEVVPDLANRTVGELVSIITPEDRDCDNCPHLHECSAVNENEDLN